MTVLIAEAKRKLQKLLYKIVKEHEKKGIKITFKKTVSTIVNKRNNTPCQLQIENTKINQVQHFEYQGVILPGKCDTEIRRHNGGAKYAFQMLRKLLRKR